MLRLRCLRKVDPVLTRTVRMLGRQNFYDIPCAQLVIKGDHFAVYFGPDRFIAYF